MVTLQPSAIVKGISFQMDVDRVFCQTLSRPIRRRHSLLDLDMSENAPCTNGGSRKT